MSGAAASTTSPRTPRSDGQETREKLLQAALRLFSERGFARTSVRAIAQAAGANVAAVRYHFGDKAGLYRATFDAPAGSAADLAQTLLSPALSLEQALQAYFSALLAPLKHDTLARQCIRLHVRELMEPTHLWSDVLVQQCKPTHDALAQRLCQHLGSAQPDESLHALAFSIHGLALQLWSGRDALFINAPTLAQPCAVDAWVQRLTGYALAMLQAHTPRAPSPTGRETHSKGLA